jgi:hypothetical protein
MNSLFGAKFSFFRETFNGFCTSPLFTIDFKREYCGMTCKCDISIRLINLKAVFVVARMECRVECKMACKMVKEDGELEASVIKIHRYANLHICEFNGFVNFANTVLGSIGE